MPPPSPYPRTPMPALLLAGVLLAVAAGPVAAEPGIDKLNLRQCVDLALADNPDLAAGRARIEQADAGIAQAEAGRMPRVAVSVTATRTDDPMGAFGLRLGQGQVDPATDFTAAGLNDPDPANNLNTRVEVTAPIYTGGQLGAQSERARALARAARAGDNGARQLLIRQVAEAYQGVHTARAYLQVSGESLKAAEETVRVSENLLKQGVAVKSDLLTARVRLEDARLRVDEARRREAGVLDRLKVLLGRPITESIEVGEPFAATLLAEAEPALLERARTDHPSLLALREQARAARAQVNAARAGNKPRIDVMARQDWNDDGIGLSASSYTLAGVLSWQAFDGGATAAAVAQAQAGQAEIEARLRHAEAGVLLDLREARRLALEAETRLAARSAAVQDAEEASRLTALRYRNGLTTLVDMLAAQTQLDKARADRVAARHELEISRIELKRAAGLLSVETL